MKNILASIIIPFYNAELFLGEAIESVLEQSYQALEIIAIDDGSTDKSADIARSYSRVRYFKQANLGPAAARNHGIRVAKADFIGFHDADDICEKERFKLQMELMQQNQNLEVTYCRIKNFVEPGADVANFLQTPQIMQARMGFISAGLMKKSVFDRVGLFNEKIRIGEDIDWIVRADNKNICSCSLLEILIRRRLHENNISKDIGQGHKNLAQILINKIKGL